MTSLSLARSGGWHAARRLARAGALALTLGLAFGCHGSSTEPEGGVIVSTRGVAFERAPGGSAAIPFVAVNVGRSPVYLPRCGDRVTAVVDRWEGDEWVEYSGDACIAILPMVPLALQPGQRHAGEWTVADPGRYRLRISVSWNSGGEGAWWTRSEAFFVR